MRASVRAASWSCCSIRRTSVTSVRVSTAPSVPPVASRIGSQLTRSQTISSTVRDLPLPGTCRSCSRTARPVRSAATAGVDSGASSWPVSSNICHGGSKTLWSASWSNGRSISSTNVAFAFSIRPWWSTTATPSPSASIVRSSSSRCVRRCSVRRTRSSRSRVTAITTSRVRGAPPGGTSTSTWWRLITSSAGAIVSSERRSDTVSRWVPSAGIWSTSSRHPSGGSAGTSRSPNDWSRGPRSREIWASAAGFAVLDAAVSGVEDPDTVVEVLDERSDEFARGCQHLLRTSRGGGRHDTPPDPDRSVGSRAPWSVDGAPT